MNTSDSIFFYKTKKEKKTNYQNYLFINFRTLYANVPFIAVLFTLPWIGNYMLSPVLRWNFSLTLFFCSHCPWIVGMVIYSTYIKCDPLEDGYITKYDEILPFFVHDKLMYIPGCLGLFMATLFNGALW